MARFSRRMVSPSLLKPKGGREDEGVAFYHYEVGLPWLGCPP